jgi:hypothetical protein
MGDCLARESFFPSDCIFLENGTGPCLFPDSLRPERCIISFCGVEPSVRKRDRPGDGWLQSAHPVFHAPAACAALAEMVRDRVHSNRFAIAIR